jgi:hypothetical protein
VVSLLSGFALAVQGFHPYAEDGGLYVAGIKKVLDPNLYPVHPEFVLAHLRFSPFAGFVAALTRLTHVPLPWVLLALYCASVWATLYGGWMLAARCTENVAARCGAVALLACWLTMPIAGTSLILLDPYVTARSISTPLALFALAWAMDALSGSRRGVMLCGAALILALVHPLMAGYAIASVATLLVMGSSREWVRRWGPWALAAVALGSAVVIQASAPRETPDYVWAAMTRYYWFPLRWQWYEQIGLLAPLLVLFALGRSESNAKWRLLARSAIVLGTISLAVALIFARAGLATHLVARLQPLRCFQMVYEVMILLLGAWVGQRWLKQSVMRWCLMLTILGGVMFFAQRSTYPASAHFELPWVTPKNPWSRAFLWIRDHSAKDTVFALDAHYITREGEDAQGFRGIAERSMLPDYSKDGGEASITPELSAAWAAGQAAQTRLDQESDEVRTAKLQPLGVSWVVLEANATTDWDCPYRNEAVKVCRVR